MINLIITHVSNFMVRIIVPLFFEGGIFVYKRRGCFYCICCFLFIDVAYGCGHAKARPYGVLIVKKLFELSNRQLFELFFIIALEGVVFVVFKSGGGRMPFVK